MYTIEELYDLTHTLAAEYLRGFTYPWEALGGIKDMILALGPAPVSYTHLSSMPLSSSRSSSSVTRASQR